MKLLNNILWHSQTGRWRSILKWEIGFLDDGCGAFNDGAHQLEVIVADRVLISLSWFSIDIDDELTSGERMLSAER